MTRQQLPRTEHGGFRLVLGPLSVALLALGAMPAGAPEARSAAPVVDALDRTPLPLPILDPGLPVPRRDGDIYERAAAPFRLEVSDEILPYRVAAVAVLPGHTLTLAAGPRETSATATFRLAYAAGDAVAEDHARWTWRAPETPGIHALQVVREADGAAIRLTVLVMHPREAIRNGRLRGYRIGRYPDVPLRGDPAYRPPRGFVEVGPQDEDVLVSPHFTLGQFLCKQSGDPRYLAYSLPLVLKLEAVLEAVNDAGHAVPTLAVMSGYRTPAYNRAIGNTTDYSRHLWGDAADVFVDATGSGEMDDLNGDGRVDEKDARLLYRIVERVEAAGPGHVRRGGLGLYRRNAVHGPFVHVDARGAPARW